MSNKKLNFPKIPLPCGVEVLEEGHLYQVTGDTICFMHHDEAGNKVIEGATNEQLIIILMHRIGFQDNKLPCLENKEAVWHLKEALKALEKRTALRHQQDLINVEKPHNSL